MVVPPTDVARPVPVFLLDHGRTSSVVLPHGSGLARYAYGDWNWYALNRTGPLRASGTLLGPTQATVGRAVFGARRTETAVAGATRIPVEAAWRIDVEAPRAEALERALDELFTRNAERATYNALYAQTFVPHPDPYAMWHNSNHVTAEWLRRLGCEVDMNGWWSSWRVREGGGSGP